MKYIHLSILFNFLLFSSLDAQIFHHIDAPVSEDGVTFANPWAGGLNAPQFSKVNLNNDGKDDLYIFDRNGEVHLVFLNVSEAGETKYEYAPRLTDDWPRCGQFAYLRDFNHDNVPDLFTHAFIEEGYAGIRVYKGKFQDWKLTFERIKFPDFETDALFYTQDGERQLLSAETPDLPAIDDIDGDEDLDILTLEPGGGYVRYYQNMSHEMGYTDDTLIYALSDACWGKFYIQPFAESLTLSCSPDLCALDCLQGPVVDDDRNGGVHGGATLCTFDENGDGDKELLYGDLIYRHLIFGINGGDNGNAWMNDQDTTFPSYNLPAEVTDFASSFYFDYDNDGLNDLMVSTNLKSGAFDSEVGWFYKNMGTNSDHDFALQGTDFMVRDMIDMGSGAHPAFIDYNADGLMDFVVANNTRYAENFQLDQFLFLFENVGTPTEPSFELVDRNWLDFNQFSSLGSDAPYAFAPAFGDLDNDGDLDLLTGERNGGLFYVENNGGAGNPVDFGPIQPLWKNVNVGQFSTPFIHDVNGDDKPDLIIGERNGTLNYFPNIGTATEPDFHPDADEAPNNNFFGEINTQVGVTGFSAPTILEFPNGEMQVVTGSKTGYLQHHRIDPSKLDGGAFEQLASELGGSFRQGFNTHPAFADLNGDEFLDAVIGNERGGIGLFSSPISIEGLVDAEETVADFGLNIFPNPAQDELTIQLKLEGIRQADYRIFNALGQLLAAGQMTSNQQTINLKNWEKGVYFLEIEISGEKVVKRFVKQ